MVDDPKERQRANWEHWWEGSGKTGLGTDRVE